MTWWEIARLFLAVAVAGCVGGLMGGWAAERRLDRVWDERTQRPRLNDQTLADADDRGPANPGGGGG